MRSIVSFLFVLFVFASSAQPVFVRLKIVDPSNDEVTIRNWSSIAINMQGFAFCHNGNATFLDSLPVLYGNLTVGKGDSVTFAMSLSDTGDLALHTNDFCAHYFYMDHYVQWGSGGHPGEQYAVQANLWDASDFLPQASKYVYHHSHGIQGISDWQQNNTRWVEYPSAPVIEMFPNPAGSSLQLTSNKPIKKFKVFSSHGQRVNAAWVNNAQNTIDISLLPAGSYSIIFEMADGFRSQHSFCKL